MYISSLIPKTTNSVILAASTLILIVIFGILIFRLQNVSKKIKIIYFSIISLCIFYILNIDWIYSEINIKNNRALDEYSEFFYSKYIKNYKNKYPQTLEFIASRNLGYIPIYYINLDRSIERRNLMENNLEKYGIKAKRISAIDGGNIERKYETDITPNLKEGEINGIKYVSEHSNITTYELGCTLSHLKAISQAYNDGNNLALIFEDDIGLDLIPHWKKTLPEIIERDFPTDWNIVNLNPTCSIFKNNKILSYKDTQCWLTTAYIINRKGMESILSLKKNNIFHLTKAKYGSCKKDGSSDCYLYSVVPFSYAYNNSLFYTRPSRTTIGSSDFSNSNNSVRKIKKFRL
jgi:glycosyl transferase family 25